MIGRTLVAHHAIAAVDLAMELVGGASFYRATGLERRFRDIQGARFHPLQASPQARYAGAMALGLPTAAIGLSVSDATVNFGDPVATATLGWSAGNWHWKLAAAASIPAGAYQPGELSNLAFNRWIGDFSAGLTYLDPALGLDISTVVGFTVNGKNPDTDYRTGQEFHIDVGISKNLTKELSVGLIGSHYQQITGDSGQGATLGPYKGRVTAVGGTVGYTFIVGSTPVATRVKLLREVDVKNRPQGTIGWVQLSFPLWMPAHSAHSAKPAVVKN